MLCKNSVSVSQTFKTIKHKGEFEEWIECLSERLEHALSKRDAMGKHLGLELKDTKYNQKLKSKKLPEYI